MTEADPGAELQQRIRERKMESIIGKHNMPSNFIKPEEFLSEIFGIAYDINFFRLYKKGLITFDEYSSGKKDVMERRPKNLALLICDILRSQQYASHDLYPVVSGSKRTQTSVLQTLLSFFRRVFSFQKGVP